MKYSGLAGKTAIVTGATSGIGKGISLALQSEKVNLILSGRDANKVKDLTGGNEASTKILAGDIKEADYNKALVDLAINEFGQLNYLVLSAGQLGIEALDKLSIEDWNNTIATNLNAVFYLLKYAIPAIKNSGGGSIVIIGSVAAHHAFPNHPAYCASKGALEALVRQVAADYGPEIRINLVNPAQVQTPLLDASVEAFPNPDEILAETANKLPMKRIGTPSDIANTALFLLSDDASWTTGSSFNVDGGFLAT
ncbi:MAG: oxidoreductase [Thalassobius sp.]|nr:oxidoreductase [Thalassovita sp.]